MSARRVLVTDYAWPSLDIERRILAEVGAELVVAETGEPDELVALAADVDAILTNWKRCPPRRSTRRRAASSSRATASALDNIPVEHATELGILVANVPDFCLEEVSDHAMALAARLRAADRHVRARDPRGHLGPARCSAAACRACADRRSALDRLRQHRRARSCPRRGASACACSPTRRGRTTGRDAAGVEPTNDLDRLLAESDYVSLHAPATPETPGLIGEAELRAMKPTAYLINTSRGALVDEAALLRALEEGWIAGAALDVLRRSRRPRSPAARPGQRDRDAARGLLLRAGDRRAQTKAATNVASVLTGSLPPTVVNPGVRTRPSYRAGL